MKPSRKPRPAESMSTAHDAEAWWYENKGSIDVYIRTNGEIQSCRISKRAIKSP